MSSTEFRNKDNENDFESFRRMGARKDNAMPSDKSFLEKERQLQPEERVKKPLSIRERLEEESDRRFESMRAEESDPRFYSEDDLDEDEEYTGPRRFDDEDNRSADAKSDDDVMSENEREIIVALDARTSPEEAKSKWFHATKKNTTVDVVDTEEKNEKKGGEKKEQTKHDVEGGIRDLVIEEDEVKESDRRLIKRVEEDILSGKVPTVGALPAGTLTERTVPQPSVERRGQRLRVRGPSASSSPYSYRRSSRERANGGLSRNSRRNRSRASRRRQSGGSSRRRFRYDSANQSRRQLRRLHQRHNRPMKRRNNNRPAEIAMDSQEMADANEKQMLMGGGAGAALDSREMAAKYEQQVNDDFSAPRRQRSRGSFSFRSGGISRRRKRNGRRAFDW